MLINIPGHQAGIGRNHGWPLTYLHREEPDPPHREGVISCRVYRLPDIWSLTTDVADFHRLRLLVNISVIFMLTAIAGAAIEYLRRVNGTFLRFGLRTAGVGIVAFSVFFTWVHYRVAGWNHMRPAIEQLERAGGRIQYQSVLPEWIRELMGDRLGRPYDNVLSVDLSYSPATDADLRPLQSLLAIRSLNLASTQITDTGLEFVSALTQLTWLSVDNTKVTDEGLVHLRPLRRLTSLNLDATRIEGRGLENLAGMDQLEILAIRNGNLTDSGLDHLIGLANVFVVYTSGTRVTRAGADRFQARSVKHISVDWRVGSSFDHGALPSPWNGETDPFR